jgi:hypothetical protein
MTATTTNPEIGEHLGRRDQHQLPRPRPLQRRPAARAAAARVRLGVPAWANWRTALPGLSADLRVLAPDIVGFGYTDRPEHFSYTCETGRPTCLAFSTH